MVHKQEHFLPGAYTNIFEIPCSYTKILQEGGNYTKSNYPYLVSILK